MKFGELKCLLEYLCRELEVRVEPECLQLAKQELDEAARLLTDLDRYARDLDDDYDPRANGWVDDKGRP